MKRCEILVVEDSPADRASIKIALVKSGYPVDVSFAVSGSKMRALPADGESLLVTHHTLEDNPLPYPVHLRQVSRRLATSLRCSMCNRLRRKNETAWLEPEQAVVSGQTALVIHTVCSDCRKSIVGRQAGISVPLMVT